MKLQTIIRTSCTLLLMLVIGIGIHSLIPKVFAADEATVINGNTEHIMPVSATVMGEVTDQGAAPVIGVWAQYGTDTNYGNETQRNNLNELTLPGTFDVPLSGLTCNTIYHYRFKIRNNAMVDGYSSDATFKTSECYADNIVSHWTLNEASGTRADSVGTNDLTPTNNPLAKTGAINDGVEATSADSSYLSIPDNASLSTGGGTSFTISLWVKLNAKTGTQVFVSKYGTGGEYAVYYENTYDRFAFSTYSSENNYFVKADQLGSPQVGTWYHIIATHNATDNTNSIIVNDGTADTLTSVPEHVDSTAPFVIGAFGATPTFFADAIIDDVRFAKSAYPVPTPLPLFAGGDGTVGNPYQVSTCQQLQDINQHLDAHYILVNDIDCSATATWNSRDTEWVDGIVGGTLIPDAYTAVTNNGYSGFDPIGRAAVDNGGFTGTFNGQGHTISKLWIFRKTSSFAGLFGAATGATITNTTLQGSRIVGGEYTGGFLGHGSGVTLTNLTNDTGMERAYLTYRGGGIAGYLNNSSTINNATVSSGTVHGSGNIIGGLVGEMIDSTVVDSNTSAAIDGGENIGGAFGSVYTSTITNVHATGNVVSNSNENDYVFIVKTGNYSGGFAGYVANTAITNSSATGNVTAAGSFTGGFAGYVSSGSIDNSYATGTVSGHGSVGGFVGYNESAGILNAYATGDVTGASDNVGGFAGASTCNATITHSYASGNVSTPGNYVGGFTGSDGCEGPGTTYNQVAAHGSVTGANYVGGFVGQSNVSTFTDVYASGNVTADDHVGGFAGSAGYSALTHVYARGGVHVRGPSSFAGGFIGEASGLTPTESFWDGDTAIIADVCSSPSECATGITQLTTTQAKTAITYTDAGWDFTTIWSVDSLNDRYPHFQWESFGEGFQTVTVVNGSVTDIAQTSATLHAQITAGDANAYGFFWGTVSHTDNEMPVPSMNAFGEMMNLYPSNQGNGTPVVVATPFSYQIPVGTLTCGTRYYYRPLVYKGFEQMFGLGIGDEKSFTTLPCTPDQSAPTVTVSSGQGRPWAPVTSSVTPVKNNPVTPDTCPADQILTQNMKAGARNGVYHQYTKAIVKEVKILQGHMNRLGFKSGPVDGILGKITDSAIKRMQVFLGTKADGFIGPVTRGLINKSCGANGLQKS